jgi:hypothetical protein
MTCKEKLGPEEMSLGLPSEDGRTLDDETNLCGWQVDGTNSESCLILDFAISDIEVSESVVTKSSCIIIMKLEEFRYVRKIKKVSVSPT